MSFEKAAPVVDAEHPLGVDPLGAGLELVVALVDRHGQLVHVVEGERRFHGIEPGRPGGGEVHVHADRRRAARSQPHAGDLALHRDVARTRNWL